MNRAVASLLMLMAGTASFGAAALGTAAPARAEALLIRNATVHTQTSRGTLPAHDVLVIDGRIAKLGTSLEAPAGATVVEAEGRALTPGVFGGIGIVGVQDIGLEDSVEDANLQLGEMRPEFDVRLAFNPDSAQIANHRSNGVTFAVIAPGTTRGGSIVAGQGGIITLTGARPGAERALFIDLGGDSNSLAGGSRAGQFMLLRQALIEARSPNLVLVHDNRLLTPAGRQTLLEFLKGAGPIVFDVDRASDIRQVLDLASNEKLPVVIRGGAEAWRVAPELAAAGVPVLLDALANLPASFDAIGATLENAARLHRAGVTVGIAPRNTDAYEASRLRQHAGNAVAHGLPWDAGLAAITRVPAEVFGVGGAHGSIEAGRVAELVLWSGDPLDVSSLPLRVIAGGRDWPIDSRQIQLRNRYLERVRSGAAR
jgi:hypothetical protein